MPTHRFQQTLYRNRRALFLAAVSLLLPLGCYERVVKVRQGTYRGNVYDGNLPSNTKGIWQDPAFGQGSLRDQQKASELHQNANSAYQRQLKDLGASSGENRD